MENGDVIKEKKISIDNNVLKIRTKEEKILSYSFMNEFEKYITE